MDGVAAAIIDITSSAHYQLHERCAASGLDIGLHSLSCIVHILLCLCLCLFGLEHYHYLIHSYTWQKIGGEDSKIVSDLAGDMTTYTWQQKCNKYNTRNSS